MEQRERGGSAWCRRCPSGSQPCLLISCHAHLLPLLSPAAIPPAHSSSVLAVPTPCARPTAPSPLAPLCSTPASPSISRLSCPTSPTPRTIRLPQCICRQQDGQPGWCFSRYCGCPPPGLHGPLARAWAPHPRSGRLVSAGVPRSTSAEQWLQPQTATGVQASEPAAAGGRTSRHSPPQAAAAGSQSWCWGRGRCYQGPGWLEGETPVVPGCGRSFLQRGAHACASPGCCQLPSLACSVRMLLRAARSAVQHRRHWDPVGESRGVWASAEAAPGPVPASSHGQAGLSALSCGVGCLHCQGPAWDPSGRARRSGFPAACTGRQVTTPASWHAALRGRLEPWALLARTLAAVGESCFGPSHEVPGTVPQRVRRQLPRQGRAGQGWVLPRLRVCCAWVLSSPDAALWESCAPGSALSPLGAAAVPCCTGALAFGGAAWPVPSAGAATLLSRCRAGLCLLQAPGCTSPTPARPLEERRLSAASPWRSLTSSRNGVSTRTR